MPLGGNRFRRDVALLPEVRIGEKTRDAAVVGDDLDAIPGELRLQIGRVRESRLDGQRAGLKDLAQFLEPA